MTLNWPALRVAGLYALLGVGWAVLSEKVMLAFSPDPLVYSQIGIWREVVFILATAFLLFLLTGKQSTGAREPSAGSLKRASVGSLILVFAVLATTIVLLGLGGVAYTAGKQKEKEIERLQAISDLKVGQIVAWLEERHADAQIMRGDDSLFELYETWRATGDETARRKLMGRLEVHRDAFNYLDILLLDESGKVVMAAGKAEHSAAPNLLETARRAIATEQILSTDLYRIEDKTPARVHLDFIVPLRVAKGRPKMAVALQADPNRFLFPFIQSWPVPSASAETLLFRRDGDQVLFLNELRHRADTALKQRVPMTRKDLLAVQALEGRTAAGGMVEGVDYRPVPVLGVAKAIPGTPWFLVAKLDRSELYAQAKRDAGWITLAETLALVAAAAATILLYQRQELRFSLIQREQQADKLRAFQLLDAIAEGSTDAIYAKDAAGRYLLLNRELSRFAGKTKAEILGRDDTVIFPPAEAARLMAGDRRIVEAGRIETTEEMLPTIGGARIFLVTRGPLLDAEGKTIGLFGIARDITEHKYQERELQTSEARFRAIFDGVNDAIFLHDAESGAIIDANARLTEMFGYSRREARHLRMDDLCANAYTHEEARQCIGRAQRGENPVFEWLARRRDGSQFWVEASLRRAEIGGRACILELVRDITEHKLATEEIRRLNETLERRMAERIAEIEHARREIDSFSRSVSHDLRALLLAIDGFVRTPLEAESGSLGPEERTRLDRIARNVASVRLFIEDLLEFTRLSRSDMRLCEVDMQLLAQEALNEFAEDHPVAERRLGTLPPAAGDPDMLRIVLGTLIGNAFRYCAGEDKPGIEIGARQQDGATVYFVRDNGPGFDTESGERLFGIFRRRHAQAGFPGTGTGLATVKRIIERHGGRLWAEAAADAGVTFYFTLDSASSASAPGAVADS